MQTTVWAPSGQVVIVDVNFSADVIPELKTLYFVHMLTRTVYEFQSGRLTLCFKHVNLWYLGLGHNTLFLNSSYFVPSKAHSVSSTLLSKHNSWCFFCLASSLHVHIYLIILA